MAFYVNCIIMNVCFSLEIGMKALLKSVLVAGVVLSGMAFADPIVGTWKMSEKGKEKVIIKITESGGTFSGVVTEGLTDKAKKTVGKTVLTGVKAVEGGKYKGKGVHPGTGIKAGVTITINGNNITIKSLVGTQTGVKQ